MTITTNKLLKHLHDKANLGSKLYSPFAVTLLNLRVLYFFPWLYSYSTETWSHEYFVKSYLTLVVTECKVILDGEQAEP
jgi:hypothetical protein